MTTGSSTKRYETPNHPYQEARIADEIDLVGRYGLTNKEELWRAQSELRNYRREARRLIGDAQGDLTVAEDAGAAFLESLRRNGVLSETDGITAVLELDVTDVLERRLQTIVYRQGLANTVGQARQFVVHGHVTVEGGRVTRPSYKVNVHEEDAVSFDNRSPLDDELHPERAEGQ
jgi:SSU ribosomal protein S4P